MVPKSREAKMIRKFRVDNSDLYVAVKARGGWISLLKSEKKEILKVDDISRCYLKSYHISS